MKCESDFVYDAKGDYATSTGYTSFGAVQIHLSAHPEISREMAEDPEYALNFMAMQWKAGHQSLWTCAGIVAP